MCKWEHVSDQVVGRFEEVKTAAGIVQHTGDGFHEAASRFTARYTK